MKISKCCLIFFILLVLPKINVFAGTFLQAIGNGSGGTYNLTKGVTYTGAAYIGRDTIVNGNGAIIELSGTQMISIGGGAEVRFENIRITGGKGIYVSAAAGNHFTGKLLTIEKSADSGIGTGGGRITLDRSVFRNCRYGLNLYSNAVADSVTSCTFSDINDTAILVNASSLKLLKECTITRAKKNGVSASGISDMTISNCRFEDSRGDNGGAYCLSIAAGSGISVVDTIFSNVDTAAYMRDCKSTLFKRCTVRNSANGKGNGYILDKCTFSMENSEITSATFGMHVYNGSVADSISSCTFSDITNTAVLVTASTIKSFRNCRITRAAKNALNALDVSQLTISDCRFEDNINFGTTGYLLSLAECKKVTISGSTFRKADAAVYMEECPDVKIQDSIIQDCKGGSGLIASSSSFSFTNGQINNCKYGINAYNGSVINAISSSIFSGFTDSAILVTSARVREFRQCTITGAVKNAFVANAASEINISACRFEKNSNPSGMSYCVSFKNCLKTIIQNSVFAQSDMAIYLYKCSGARLQGITIADCEESEGILIQGAAGAVEVADTSVSHCRAGIAVMDGASATVKNCSLRDNHKGLAPYKGQGVFVMNHSSMRMFDTSIIENDNEGIYSDGSPTTVVRCLVSSNGWGAKDGNGINFIESPGAVIDTKVIGNYLFGIQAVGDDIIIRGCEVLGNRNGGINLSANAPGRVQQISGTIADHNTYPGMNTYELNCNSSRTTPVISNSLFSSNSNIGALIQRESHPALFANIFDGNKKKNLNVYKANVRCIGNVFARSSGDIFLNTSPLSDIHDNDILEADCGADAMLGSTDNLSGNWWGSATGPYSQVSNPQGKGTPIRNIKYYEPWKTSAGSYYTFFRNFALPAGQERVLASGRMPFVKFRILSGAAYTSQILVAQASNKIGLFPHLALPSGLPSKTLHLWIAASQESRLKTLQAVLELNTSDGILGNLSKLKVLKYNADECQWVSLEKQYLSAQSILRVPVGDILGNYLVFNGPFTAAEGSWNDYQ